MDIDKYKLANMPINTNEPMFLVAECFKDTLIEIGLDEDSAETARRAFYTLKKDPIEETQNKIRRIASKISIQSSNSEKKALPRMNCGERSENMQPNL